MASVFVLLEAFNRKEAAALGFFPCATASLFMDAEPSPSGEGVCGPARRRMRGACAEIACLRQAAENCGGVKAPRPTPDDTVRCRAACPHAAAVIAPFFRSPPR